MKKTIFNYILDDGICDDKYNAYVDEIDNERRDKVIRISVASVLTVGIIILTVTLYCYSKT